MTENNDEPRSSQAPAEQSGQNDADKAAPIRNQEAYERSQAEKAARLAGKASTKVEALEIQVTTLNKNVSDLLAQLTAEREARATAEKTAKREQMIQSAASKFQLPAELAKRLHGETAEELEADAAELAKLVKPQTPNAPSTQTRTLATGNIAPPKGENDSELARRLVDRIRNGKTTSMRFTEPYNPDDNPDLSSGGG